MAGRLASAFRSWPPRLRLLLVAALVVVAAAGAYAALDHVADSRPPECPGHWHATFVVFVDGHQVHFDRPAFFQTPTGLHDYHMHADDQIIHFHPPLADRCIPLRSFMGRLGIELGSDWISFNENFGANQGRYAADGTRTLEVHYKDFGQDWRRVDWSEVSGRQMRPGDKVLVTYGVLTPELVEQQRAEVRDLGKAYLGFDPEPETDTSTPPAGARQD